jgi:hypothetical protein
MCQHVFPLAGVLTPPTGWEAKGFARDRKENVRDLPPSMVMVGEGMLRIGSSEQPSRESGVHLLESSGTVMSWVFPGSFYPENHTAAQ